MALLLAVVMALIPMAIAPGWLFYFDVTPKIVALLLGTAAASVWWAATGGTFSAFRASRVTRWFVLTLCGMALSLAVSTIASVNALLSLGGSNWRYWGLITQFAAMGFAFLVCAACAGRPDRLRVILRSIAASGLIVALYGIAQYFGWDPLLDARGYHEGDGIYAIVRPPATLGHADYAANWLLFVIFASVALAVSETQTVWKWLARAAVTASSVAIALSGTRAALLGLAAGILILIPMFWLDRWGRRFRWPYLALPVLIVAASAAFYVSPAGEKMRARVHWALQEPAGGARFLLWRDSLRMAGVHWLAGFGPETYIASFARYQSADLSRAYPDFYHESPHNIYLDTLVSQGVPGPLLLLALAASGFAAAWSMRRNPAAIALAAGLAAMTLSDQFTSFTMPTALAYYAAVALLVSIAIGGNPSPAPAGPRWPRLLVATCGAGVLAVFAVRLCVAEMALATVRHDLDANRVTDGATNYAEYERWRWPGASADLWYSRRLAQIAGSRADRMLRIEAFQRAGEAAGRAPQTTEAPFNAYYNLAAFYAARNDFAHTEQALRAAISVAPNWFKTHWMLAQVLQAASRLSEAEAEAGTAASLDGGKHAEVTGTLAHIRTALAGAPAEPPHK